MSGENIYIIHYNKKGVPGVWKVLKSVCVWGEDVLWNPDSLGSRMYLGVVCIGIYENDRQRV